MDKSEQYIKMCESAREIQKTWSPDIGDWFLNDYRGTTEFPEDVEKQIWTDKKEIWEKVQCLTYKTSIKDYVTISEPSGTHVYTMQDFFKHRHVFLPSQDYLQKMLGDINKSCEMFIRKLHTFYNPERFCINREDDVIIYKCETIGTERRNMFSTMEQITLAYVMIELYNKKWNGSEWIKIEESD